MFKSQIKKKLATYNGIFQEELSFSESVSVLVSGVIGAGILAIPFTVAKVGIGIGMLYIIGMGLSMMGLHLLLGELTIQTNHSYQLSGLAKKYLGFWGYLLMSIMVYLMLFGVLVVYTIGIGESAAALLGGSTFWWSLALYAPLSIAISAGLKTVKKAELLLQLGLFFVVGLIALKGISFVNLSNFQYTNIPLFFFPFGVMLFAYHGTTVVPEVHALMKKKDTSFKKVIIVSHLIIIAIYAIFALISVGVMGPETTEIATIGLGEKLGESVFLLGNIFALITMSSSFLMAGTAIKDSLVWDSSVPKAAATAFVITVPLFIFVLGLRDFTKVISIVGGVFGSVEMLLILLMYWKFKKSAKKRTSFGLHHTALLCAFLTGIIGVGFVYSFISLV